MIRYSKEFWGLKTLLTWYGSAYPRALPIALACGALAGILEAFFEQGDHQWGSHYPYQLFAFMVGFMIIFRSNLSYGRYWEGRGYLQIITAKITDAVVHTLAFDQVLMPDEPTAEQIEAHLRFKDTFIHLCSLLHAICFATLREDFNMDNLVVHDSSQSAPRTNYASWRAGGHKQQHDKYGRHNHDKAHEEQQYKQSGRHDKQDKQDRAKQYAANRDGADEQQQPHGQHNHNHTNNTHHREAKQATTFENDMYNRSMPQSTPSAGASQPTSGDLDNGTWEPSRDRPGVLDSYRINSASADQKDQKEDPKPTEGKAVRKEGSHPSGKERPPIQHDHTWYEGFEGAQILTTAADAPGWGNTHSGLWDFFDLFVLRTGQERAAQIYTSMKMSILGGLTQAEGTALGAFSTLGVANAVPEEDVAMHGYLMDDGSYAPAPTERAHTVLMWVFLALTRRIREGGVPAAPPIQARIHAVLSDAMLGYEQARKLVDTQFPYPWAQAITVVLMIFCCTAPFLVAAFVDSVVAAVLVTFIAVHTYIMLNEVGRDIEDPFLFDPNELHLPQLQFKFNERLLAISRTEQPAAFTDFAHLDGPGNLPAMPSKHMSSSPSTPQAPISQADNDVKRSKTLSPRASFLRTNSFLPSRSVALDSLQPFSSMDATLLSYQARHSQASAARRRQSTIDARRAPSDARTLSGVPSDASSSLPPTELTRRTRHRRTNSFGIPHLSLSRHSKQRPSMRGHRSEVSISMPHFRDSHSYTPRKVDRPRDEADAGDSRGLGLEQSSAPQGADTGELASRSGGHAILRPPPVLSPFQHVDAGAPYRITEVDEPLPDEEYDPRGTFPGPIIKSP